MKTETDLTQPRDSRVRIMTSMLTDFVREFWDDVLPFIRRRPALASLLVVNAFLLASGDLIEGLPFAKPIMGISGFSEFHNIHNALALAFVVIVAYHWNISMGGLLLGVFFLAHVPNFYLTFPGKSMEFLELIIESAVATGFIGIILKRNIALRKATEAAERSAHLAGHDPLTDLPNRALFKLEAQRTMAVSKRNNSIFAVMFVDVNDFKDVNDSLGHDIGDLCLTTIAERLREAVREEDIVARLGGDEFAIIAKDLGDVEDAAFLADRAIACTSEPIVIHGHRLNIGLSIGIDVYPAPAQNEPISDSMQLLTQADMAMYKAKAAGESCFKFYSREMSVEASERISVLEDLRHAVEKEQMMLFYQPLLDMRTGLVVGAEALLRWNHPEKGVLLPELFIPAAETSGRIIPIGRWVMEQACAQNRIWQDAGLPRIKMSVNLSPVQLRSQPIVDTVSLVLERTGLDARYLDLELTENVFIRNIKHSSQVLRKLRNLGVTISIDDFGTGYSSLSALQQLSVDTVKIDRVFVTDIRSGTESAAIVEAVIKLGHSLGLTVTAEGIETEAELEYLRHLGCDYAQGHYFSPAVTAQAFARLLEDNSSVRAPV